MNKAIDKEHLVEFLEWFSNEKGLKKKVNLVEILLIRIDLGDFDFEEVEENDE